jgi:ABC-type sugar transport system permease subunit
MNRQATPRRRESLHAALLIAPAAGLIVLAALLPIVVTVSEALHGHDLRLPWLGRPFVGLANFVEAAGDPRFVEAAIHTALFALVSVPIELALGLALAVVMHRAVRGRAVIRVAALLPWTVPTVVAALIWRFMFESFSTTSFNWFIHPLAAWVPIAAADVWKTTPFVAILLLAGLQTIDPALDEAARIDGAGPLRRFTTITLPLLAPALVVATAFRVLDALRLFDLVYVMTGGGPGTATEPLSLYAFVVLMQHLRFGYGAALSMTVFLFTFAFAVIWIRTMGRTLTSERA